MENLDLAAYAARMNGILRSARWSSIGALVRVGIGLVAAAVTLKAQHQHGAHSGPPADPSRPMPAQHAAPGHPQPAGHAKPAAFAGIPHTRDASGTAWQPDATPMHALMRTSPGGEWQHMAHYNVFLGYDRQSGPRGGEQFNSLNWLMLMASRGDADQDLTLRGMFTLEPWTTSARGYPLLFQSGEAYHGEPLVDRQHPHDFFMEVAARYRRTIADEAVGSIYVAPAGEPALGPPAFPHRMSAMDNPTAPTSHHWIDSTHISFGVLTAGIARKTWQLEGSWFNGREPDEDRWDLEKPNLDSYAGRFTWNPGPAWSAQISRGFLKSPEELHPHDPLYRTTASLMHVSKSSGESHVATTAAWGRNDTHDARTNAFLLETTYMTTNGSVFARAEQVEKLGSELELLPPEKKIRVKQLTVGATRELVRDRPYQLAAGGALTYTFTPGGAFGRSTRATSNLDEIYGRHPIGVWIFLRLRPALMRH